MAHGVGRRGNEPGLFTYRSNRLHYASKVEIETGFMNNPGEFLAW